MTFQQPNGSIARRTYRKQGLQVFLDLRHDKRIHVTVASLEEPPPSVPDAGHAVHIGSIRHRDDRGIMRRECWAGRGREEAQNTRVPGACEWKGGS